MVYAVGAFLFHFLNFAKNKKLKFVNVIHNVTKCNQM